MKTKLYLAMAMLLCCLAPSFAQEQPAKPEMTPEERAQRRAETAAQRILISDADAAKFIPIYKSYILESRAIMQKYKPEKPGKVEGQKPPIKTDAQIDADIRAQFKKSHELLSLRESYYEKYLKILSPRQIRELYRMEKQAGEKANLKKHGNH